MKYPLRFAIALFLVILTVACSGSEKAETSEPASNMVHIGNFDVGTTNKLILAASAADAEYLVTEPYGEGCTDESKCVWGDGDQAFHIEKDKQELFWQAWYAYCQTDPEEELCLPEIN